MQLRYFFNIFTIELTDIVNNRTSNSMLIFKLSTPLQVITVTRWFTKAEPYIMPKNKITASSHASDYSRQASEWSV